jgi:hypothetical protein
MRTLKLTALPWMVGECRILFGWNLRYPSLGLPEVELCSHQHNRSKVYKCVHRYALGNLEAKYSYQQEILYFKNFNSVRTYLKLFS